ncbi:hypothetical protein Cgig2_000643 [Carnegiea gigantea]|uniref:Uncharacterized protein n=1 Tax=Carnegiea gigantea TaxID=171969 RepID=A0A9Q1JTM6_9CARY|nr:hypothetical protein Cgig2_000643 [Carnegiea gigantea]
MLLHSVARLWLDVIEHDVQVTLGLPKGPLEVVEPKNESNVNFKFASLLNRWKQQWPKRDSISNCGEVIEVMRGQVDWGEDFIRNFIVLVVSTCVHGKQRGEVIYLIMNMLVDLSKLCYLNRVVFKLSKNDKDETKPEDEIRVSKRKSGSFHDGKAAADSIITNSRLLTEVIIELEEFIPRARTPLKRVRKVAAESMSDALISDRTNKSRSRSPVLSQDSYESKGFFIEIDAIGKHFVGSQDTMHDFLKFTSPNLILRVSQNKKEALPKGVVILDSKADISPAKVQVDILMRCMKNSTQCSSTPLPSGLIMVCSQEDNRAFVDRSVMRIGELDLEIRDIQTTSNTNKGLE